MLYIYILYIYTLIRCFYCLHSILSQPLSVNCISRTFVFLSQYVIHLDESK